MKNRNFCQKSKFLGTYASHVKRPNDDLESALFGAVRPRGNGDGSKAPEKPPDKHGYGSGMESTPIGEWVNIFQKYSSIRVFELSMKFRVKSGNEFRNLKFTKLSLLIIPNW